MAQIPIVDQDDKVLYYKERSEVTLDEIYRVSACWVTNSKWEILLAQRSFTKKHDPGKWWPAVAGTVEKNMTYLQNVVKETEEEIGINIEEYSIQTWPKKLREKKHTYFCQRFFCMLDLPIELFTKEEWEVEKLKWRSEEELDEAIATCSDNFFTSVRDRRTYFDNL